MFSGKKYFLPNSGKESHTIRVRNMARLSFYPTQMVVSLAELYISLGEQESWQGAVVREQGRLSLKILEIQIEYKNDKYSQLNTLQLLSIFSIRLRSILRHFLNSNESRISQNFSEIRRNFNGAYR